MNASCLFFILELRIIKFHRKMIYSKLPLLKPLSHTLIFFYLVCRSALDKKTKKLASRWKIKLTTKYMCKNYTSMV